ncbi:MFS transporter [Nakamurella sp. PAMC28650]|nr:MFS transporter [Nakamurella sp. PAMC28650]
MRSQGYLCVLAFTSFFLTLSSLPLYSIAIGTSTGAAGLVTTVMLVSTVAAQTLVPAAVSRWGLLRVLGAGLVLLGAPAPLYVIEHQFWWVLLVSAVRGLGFAVITVLMPLVASAMVPAGRQGEAIGIYGLAIAVPNLLGVPIGVALTSAGEFRWVAIASAAPLLALPLLRPIGRAMLPRGVGVGVGVGAGVGAGAEPTRADASGAVRAIAGVTLVLLVVTLSGGGVLTFLPVVRSSGRLATVALLLFGAAGALSRWRAGALSDRWGSRVLLPTAVIVAAGGMTLLAMGLALPSTVVLLIGAVVLGAGLGAVQNVTLLVAFRRAGPAKQTTASAVWNAAYDSGTAIGALVVGLVAAGGPGFSWTFAGCAVLILATLPLAMTATRSLR